MLPVRSTRIKSGEPDPCAHNNAVGLIAKGHVALGGAFYLGRTWGEPTLMKLASGFEVVAPHRVTPPTTPPLPGEKFDY